MKDGLRIAVQSMVDGSTDPLVDFVYRWDDVLKAWIPPGVDLNKLTIITLDRIELGQKHTWYGIRQALKTGLPVGRSNKQRPKRRKWRKLARKKTHAPWDPL